jgi:hypothetical protein
MVWDDVMRDWRGVEFQRLGMEAGRLCTLPRATSGSLCRRIKVPYWWGVILNWQGVKFLPACCVAL